MLPTPLVHITSREHLFRFFSNLLLFGTLLLADGWILVRVARAWGVYLALAVEGGTALAAAVIIGSTIHSSLEKIRKDAIRGEFLPYDYAGLAGAVTAATLLLLPGFATDALGLLLYLPPGRQLFAWLFLRRQASAVEEMYEYYKMETFSAPPTGITDSEDKECDEKNHVQRQSHDMPGTDP